MAMKLTSIVLACGAIVLLATELSGQEFPKADLGVDYAYTRYSPSERLTQGHSLNGGGGSVTYNFSQYLGIKMDLQGSTSTRVGFSFPASPDFPGGITGAVQGNLLTYLFGPQVKIRAHKAQPYLHTLLGGAHSNTYSNAFTSICQHSTGTCAFTASPAHNAFAVAIGGGVDIPVTRVISLRAGEVDYLLTRFHNPFSGHQNQSNFRYMAGVVFSLGHTQ
jgi:opacity protein-like surface antigen